MLTLTQRQQHPSKIQTTLTLALTAEERTRSRHQFVTEEGETVCLRLNRGTVLRNGDILLDDSGGKSVLVAAKPEPVLTVTAPNPLDLLKAAYHLGNRHVPVEITPNYLRLSPDSVLETMLENLGLQVLPEVTPFYPESGAYGHHHHS